MHGSLKILLILFLSWPILSFGLPNFRPYTEGHMDIGPRIADGAMVGFFNNDAARIDGEITLTEVIGNTAIRVLGIFDEATPPLSRSSGSEWDFMGVGPEELIYILPSSGSPNTLPYLGFGAEDPSLNAFQSENNIVRYEITLTAIDGPPGGVFNLYLSPSLIFLSGEVGGAISGTFNLLPGDHEHYNWAFSHLGTYNLTLRIDAISSDESVAASWEGPFRFQITDGGGYEDYEEWRRTMFTLSEIADDSFSGKSADPFGEGRTNWERYLFDSGHQARFRWVEDSGITYPGYVLYHRVGMEDVSIVIESSTSLQSEDWHKEDVILHSNERIFHEPGLERRIYRLSAQVSDRIFFRARTITSP